MDGTPEAQLRAASGRRKRAMKQLENARLAERAAILAALEAGVRQVDVVEITGYTRNHVARLADEERVRADADQPRHG